MAFNFIPQKIEDVVLIEPKVYTDNRGFFHEGYKKSEFVENGIDVEFLQDNYSKSTKRVLRGLHFQTAPYEQAKLVRCIRGRIIDVALDLRPDSLTFKKYVKTELSEENKRMLYIPAGFAHGFVALSEVAEILYKVSAEYNSESERGIIWNDSDLNIDWGIDFEPILSDKDKTFPKLKEVIG